MLNITIDKQDNDAFTLSIEGEETQTLTRAQMDEIHAEIDRIDSLLADDFDKMIDGREAENLYDATYRLPFLTQRYTPDGLGDIGAYYLQYVKGYVDFIAIHERANADAKRTFAGLEDELNAAE